MALQRDVLHGMGGLVKIAPLEGRFTYGISLKPVYRLFGSEVTLSYLQTLLQHPEQAPAWRRVYQDVMGSFDEIIEVLSHDPEQEHWKPFDITYQVQDTCIHYQKSIGKPLSIPELRRKFQNFKLLLDNAHAGRASTPEEEQEKQEFLRMIQFFMRLEQDYDEHTFRHPHPDGIPLR